MLRTCSFPSDSYIISLFFLGDDSLRVIAFTESAQGSILSKTIKLDDLHEEMKSIFVNMENFYGYICHYKEQCIVIKNEEITVVYKSYEKSLIQNLFTIQADIYQRIESEEDRTDFIVGLQQLPQKQKSNANLKQQENYIAQHSLKDKNVERRVQGNEYQNQYYEEANISNKKSLIKLENGSLLKKQFKNSNSTKDHSALEKFAQQLSKQDESFPIKVHKNLILLSAGKFDPAYFYQTKKQKFPIGVGYKSLRTYHSMLKPNKMTEYICQTIKMSTKLMYCVTPKDNEKESILRESPNQCWQIIEEKIRQVNGKPYISNRLINGNNLFGFQQPRVRKILLNLSFNQ